MTIRIDAKDFERNELGYQKYDPKKQPLLCQVHLATISLADNVVNLSNKEEDKKAYEGFLKYAADLVKHHPEWDSPKYIAERIDLLKMSEIVPEAFKEYAKAVSPEKESIVAKKEAYVKSQVAVYE